MALADIGNGRRGGATVGTGMARGPGPVIIGLAGLCLALAGDAHAQTSGTAATLPLPVGATGGSASVINGDGTVVVGNAAYPSILYTPPPPFSPGTYTPNRPWRWTGGAGSTDLGAAGGHVFNAAAGISLDGTVLAGTSSSPFTAAVGWRWTEAGGYQMLALPVGTADFGATVGGITVRGLSGDGNTLVGATSVNIQRAFRWNQAGGYENIGLPGGNAPNGLPWSGSTAAAASFDGSAVAVTVFGTVTTTTQRAARWTSTGGFEIIEPTAGFQRTNALGISRDGMVIGGDLLGTGGAQQAFKWSSAGGIQPLGYVPGATFSFYTGMSGDAERIVGNSGKDGAGAFQVPFLWTTADGMRTLDAVVTAAGVNLGGLTLTRANNISSDGSSIIGNARNAANQTVPFLLVLDFDVQPILSTSFSTTTNRTLVSQSAINQTYATTVVGVLNGSPVFSRVTAEAISGGASVTALADARAAMQASVGLRQVIVDAPVRVASQTVTLGSHATTQDVVTGQSQTVFSYTSSGPTVIATGDLGECTTAGTAGAGPSGCSKPGTALIIASSRTSTNTHTNTLIDVTTTTTTTTDHRLDETYEVRGRLGNQLGTVHALAGFAAIEQGDRFIRRLLDERDAPQAAPAATEMSGGGRPARFETPWRLFGEAFGQRNSTGADAGRGIARSSGDLAGLAGGIGYQVSPGFVIGAALQWGVSSLRVQDPLAPESLNVELTQIGLFSRLRQGPLSVGFSLAYGSGRARTVVAGGTASRGLETVSAGGRIGYDLALGPVVLTPELGLRHISVRVGGFAETGGTSPLTGLGNGYDNTRAWLGLALAAPFRHEGLVFEPRLYARLTHDWGEASGRADVSFSSLPTLPLQALGPNVGRLGVDLGASVEARLTRGVGLFAAYDGRLRERSQSHTATGGVRIVW